MIQEAGTAASKFIEIKSKTEFDQFLNSNFKNISLITFYASWNEDSTFIVENIKDNFEGYSVQCGFAFVDCDLEENEDLIKELGAESLPHVVIINSNKQVLQTIEDVDPSSIFEGVESQAELFQQNYELEKAKMFAKIEKLLRDNGVVSFINGTPQTPKCNISKELITLLSEQQIKYHSIDVLNDSDNIQGWIKEFCGQTTLPLLFAKGKLLGGLDTLKETITQGKVKEVFPENCLVGDPQTQADSVLKEARLVLVVTRDLDTTPDQTNTSGKVESALQLQGLLFRTYESDKAPQVRDNLTARGSQGQLPILFYDGAVLAEGSKLLELADGEGFKTLVDANLFREDTVSRIKKILNQSPVMIFIKGTPDYPECGFSRKFLAIMDTFKIDFGYFNILSDNLIRQGLKEYSNWKTYPQFYINAELIGGLDIIKELIEEGEFKDMVAPYVKK